MTERVGSDPESAFIDIMRTVFPVVATATDSELARPYFFGTAFSVAPGVFMTAAHVVKAAREHGKLTLGGPTADRGRLGGANVDDFELFENLDVALLFCRVRDVTHLSGWLTRRAQMLTDLFSFGYPHAVTRHEGSAHFEVVFRGYKGSVITTRGFERLPQAPAVYEVSCSFPEGMSGAPLLLSVGSTIALAGLVLGESVVEYGGVPQRVGIAMIADEIAGLTSKKLDGPIVERLGLIPMEWSIG
jgi:hypothetical protein